jgi:AP-2 complex subunit alpha
LAISLLLREDTDYMRGIIYSVRRDLQDQNESLVCLALNAIPNILSKEMSSAIAGDVLKLLTSRSSFVRKKAALCLLCIVKKYPETVQPVEWSDRVLAAFADKQMVSLYAFFNEACAYYPWIL